MRGRFRNVRVEADTSCSSSPTRQVARPPEARTLCLPRHQFQRWTRSSKHMDGTIAPRWTWSLACPYHRRRRRRRRPLEPSLCACHLHCPPSIHESQDRGVKMATSVLKLKLKQIRQPTCMKMHGCKRNLDRCNVNLAVIIRVLTYKYQISVYPVLKTVHACISLFDEPKLF